MKTTEELFKIAKLNALDMGTIFKYCPEGVVIKEKNLQYITVNNSYCRIFGITNPEEICGNYINKYLSENNIELIRDADSEVHRSLTPLNYIINISNDRILSISTAPIICQNEYLGIISLVRDITQEEKIKEDFVNKHFQHINKEKQLQLQRETFVASVGHDLKNPTIAQIRGIELLLKGSFGTFTSEQKEILEMVLDSCRYMNGMLSSLLATYRNYGGAIKLNFEEFSFISLVEECISEMQYVAKDKGVNIVTNYSHSELFVSADKVQIKRVLMNLISNGIKYAFKDTELKLSIYYDNNNIRFQFENMSPYIPENRQKKLFSRYVSYSGVNKELGIGLGLYASKKIIESHTGKIFVKSFTNNRNIFGFTIPVKINHFCPKEIIF